MSMQQRYNTHITAVRVSSVCKPGGTKIEGSISMNISSSYVVALFVYLLGLLVVGFLAGRRNKTGADYLVGSKSLPTWVIILTLTATMFGGGMMVGRAQLSYQGGLPYLFYGLGPFIGYVLTALMLPKMKGFMRYTTVTEYLGARYGGKFVRTSCALLSLIALIGLTAVQVNSLVAILNVMGFGDPRMIAFFCMLIIVALTVFGGFLAVTATDVVQIIIVMVGVTILSVTAFSANGGISNVFAQLQAAQGNVLASDYFSAIPKESLGSILLLMLPGSMYMLIGQDGYQRLMACKNVKEARKAAVIAGALMCAIAAFPVLLGVLGRLDFPELATNGMTATTMGMIIMKYLPGIGGGVLLCAVLSAILSTGDSCLSAASSHFITDFYCVFVDKNADLNSKKMLTVSRLACLAGGLIAMVLSFGFKDGTLTGYCVYCYNIYLGGAFVPIVLGCLWKGANRIGTSCGIVAGSACVILGIMGIKIAGLSGEVVGSLAALIVTVIVSLATAKINPPIVISEEAE